MTKKIPYTSILTNPTTGGIMASFASLGDIIIAEPSALIGFAGPRVIKENAHQNLPACFQTSEFLLEHGLIDQVVDSIFFKIFWIWPQSLYKKILVILSTNQISLIHDQLSNLNKRKSRKSLMTLVISFLVMRYFYFLRYMDKIPIGTYLSMMFSKKINMR